MEKCLTFSRTPGINYVVLTCNGGLMYLDITFKMFYLGFCSARRVSKITCYGKFDIKIRIGEGISGSHGMR